jgi:hypothetical protein
LDIEEAGGERGSEFLVTLNKSTSSIAWPSTEAVGATAAEAATAGARARALSAYDYQSLQALDQGVIAQSEVGDPYYATEHVRDGLVGPYTTLCE